MDRKRCVKSGTAAGSEVLPMLSRHIQLVSLAGDDGGVLVSSCSDHTSLNVTTRSVVVWAFAAFVCVVLVFVLRHLRSFGAAFLVIEDAENVT